MPASHQASKTSIATIFEPLGRHGGSKGAGSLRNLTLVEPPLPGSRNSIVTIQRFAVASVVLLLLTACFGASDASDTSPAATTKPSAAVPASAKYRGTEAATCPLLPPEQPSGSGQRRTARFPLRPRAVLSTPLNRAAD